MRYFVPKSWQRLTCKKERLITWFFRGNLVISFLRSSASRCFVYLGSESFWEEAGSKGPPWALCIFCVVWTQNLNTHLGTWFFLFQLNLGTWMFFNEFYKSVFACLAQMSVREGICKTGLIVSILKSLFTIEKIKGNVRWR